VETTARQERLTLTIEEAAKALGIGRTLAYEAIKRGEIPTIRIGRRLLVPRSALDQLLGNAATNGAPPRVEPVGKRTCLQSDLSVGGSIGADRYEAA
jgi:excisionase family DNA binding protein